MRLPELSLQNTRVNSKINFTENFMIVRRIRNDSEAREEKQDWIVTYFDAYLYLGFCLYFNCIKVLVGERISFLMMGRYVLNVNW